MVRIHLCTRLSIHRVNRVIRECSDKCARIFQYVNFIFKIGMKNSLNNIVVTRGERIVSKISICSF